MSTKTRRSLSLLLAAVLLLVTVGCGSGNGNKEASKQSDAPPASTAASPSSPSSASASPSPEEKGPPEELSIYMESDDPGESMDVWSVHYVEELLNLKLNITLLPKGDGDKALNVKLASGERPDIIQFSSNDTEINLEQAGMLEPLTPYFEQYPDLYNSRPPVQWNSIKNADGHAYVLPITSDPWQFALVYRKDWLDKLGMKVPATLDEYMEVARAMTHKDPDGNGKNDTYAFAGRSDRLSFFEYIFGAYGVFVGEVMLKDGKLVDGATQPGTKEALKFIHQMYEEGLIDPEFVTDNNSRWKDKFAKGTYGAATGKIWVMNELDSYNKQFKKANPDGSWVLGVPLQGPEGIEPLGYRTGGSYRGPLRTAILSTSEHKEAALKLLNWLASPEGNTFYWAGLKDEHYQLDENGIIRSKLSSEEQAKIGIKALKLAQYDIENLEVTKEYKEIHEYVVANAWYSPVSGMIPNKTYATTQADLGDFVDETFFKMIIGQIPIEGGWEDFLAEMKKKKNDERMEDLNAQYVEWKKYAK